MIKLITSAAEYLVIGLVCLGIVVVAAALRADNFNGYIFGIGSLLIVLPTLKNNYSKEIELPDPNRYPAGSSCSYQGVFSDFRSALNVHDFELGFIETDGDEYVILVHRRSDNAVVSKAVLTIGYTDANEMNRAD